jgi:tetratricopeptide (TPR) repeat protein
MKERGEYSTAIRELLHLQSIIEEESIPQLPTYRKIEENSFAPALPKEEELAAEISFYLAENYFNQRLHQKAIEEYKKVILRYSTSPFAATASYKVAEIYDKVLEIRDFEKAAEAYFLFFSKYPNHPWSKEAEKRYYFIRKNYL